MRWMIGVATAALASGLFGGSAKAQQQSLDAAIRDALDNGCVRTGTSAGLLGAAELSTSTTTTPVGTAVNTYRLLVDNDFNPNTPPIEVFAPAVWNVNATGPIVGGNSVITLANGVDANGNALLGITVPPTNNTGPFFTFTPVAGGAPALFNNVQVQITQTQPTRITATVRPVAGLLGGDLAKLCTAASAPTPGTLTQNYVGNFTFNDQAGLKNPGAGAGSTFSSTGNALSALANASGSGLSANRAQENVVRRERSLSATIERLRRRIDRWRQGQDRGMQLAALDAFAPTMEASRPYTIMLDVSGGVVNLNRDVTPLEGGFDADSVVINASAALALRNAIFADDVMMFGAAVAHENTDSTGFGATNARSESESETTTGSLFIGWTAPPASLGFDQAALFTITASTSYGYGDQSYLRKFNASYTPVTGGAATPLSDTLSGASDQTYKAASLQVSVAQALGSFTVLPRASVTYARSETKGFAEAITDGADDGLGLRYAPVEDEWIESRVGLGLAYATPAAGGILDFSVGGDAIFIGDAETPARTAFFAQDLRASPFAIVYNVDNLDEQYADFSASIGFEFENGLYSYVSAFKRAGHDYLDADGLMVGVRFTR